MAALETKTVNWAKIGRAILRFSWWVVVFAAKIVLFIGLTILKWTEDRNIKKDSILNDSTDNHNDSTDALKAESYSTRLSLHSDSNLGYSHNEDES